MNMFEIEYARLDEIEKRVEALGLTFEKYEPHLMSIKYPSHFPDREFGILNSNRDYCIAFVSVYDKSVYDKIEKAFYTVWRDARENTDKQIKKALSELNTLMNEFKLEPQQELKEHA